MAAWLSALRAGRLLTPGRFLVLISVRGSVRNMFRCGSYFTEHRENKFLTLNNAAPMCDRRFGHRFCICNKFDTSVNDARKILLNDSVSLINATQNGWDMRKMFRAVSLWHVKGEILNNRIIQWSQISASRSGALRTVLSWNLKSCSPVKFNQCSARIQCLYRGWKVNQANSKYNETI
jgi:hypothetical protein